MSNSEQIVDQMTEFEEALDEQEKLFQRRAELTKILSDRNLSTVDEMHHGYEKMEVDHAIIHCAERVNRAWTGGFE